MEKFERINYSPVNIQLVMTKYIIIVRNNNKVTFLILSLVFIKSPKYKKKKNLRTRFSTIKEVY